MRKFLKLCTGWLIEFLGWEFQSSGPCHIVFLIKIGPNNYLKVTNVERNAPWGFYHHSKITNFWEFRHFCPFFEPDFKKKYFKNNMFRIYSIRAFVWCINCHIWVKFFFHFFDEKGGPLPQKKQNFFFQNWQFIHQ